jgi:hypothetical protein
MKGLVLTFLLAVVTQAAGVGRLSNILSNQNKQHFDQIDQAKQVQKD